MANAQNNKNVIAKLAKGQYSSSGELSNDLSRAGFSTGEANALANQYVGSKSSTSNSGSAIKNLGSGVQGGLKSAGNVLFAPMVDQNNWDRPIVKAGMLQQVFNTVIDNGLNIFDQLEEKIKDYLINSTSFSNQNIHSILTNDIPYYFLNKIEESNAVIGQQQLESYDQIINIFKNKNIIFQ